MKETKGLLSDESLHVFTYQSDFLFFSLLSNIVKTLLYYYITYLRSTLVPIFLLLTFVMFFAKKLGTSEGQVVRVLDS